MEQKQQSSLDDGCWKQHTKPSSGRVLFYLIFTKKKKKKKTLGAYVGSLMS